MPRALTSTIRAWWSKAATQSGHSDPEASVSRSARTGDRSTSQHAADCGPTPGGSAGSGGGMAMEGLPPLMSSLRRLPPVPAERLVDKPHERVAVDRLGQV